MGNSSFASLYDMVNWSRGSAFHSQPARLMEYSGQPDVGGETMKNFGMLLSALLVLLGISGAIAEEPEPGKDRLYFVQFHHPGGEHEPNAPGERSWNTGAHRRKFMQVKGSYLAAVGGERKNGNVVFWGEWEPPSLVVTTFDQPVANGPRYLFKPVREAFFESDPPLMNTDPFVYGGPFLYGNCKQNSRQGPTEMQRLARGSVILFGSNRDKQEFVLDTVLVVSDDTPYSTENWRVNLTRGVVPEYLPLSPLAISYELGVLEPGKVQHYRLYRGATPDAPVGKMFSYFPCQPWTGEGAGFARPVMKQEGVIDDTLSGWQRMNPQESLTDVEALWQEVTRQVLAQGLSLCVAADLPELRTKTEDGAPAKASGSPHQPKE